MSDLVERLRHMNLKVGDEAANEIERLRAELLHVLPALRAADGALHWARSHKETSTLAAAHEKIRAAITAVKGVL